MTGMTPSRARKLAGRWMVACVGVVALMTFLAGVGLHQLNFPIGILGVGLTLSRASWWSGWARGGEAGCKIGYETRCEGESGWQKPR